MRSQTGHCTVNGPLNCTLAGLSPVLKHVIIIVMKNKINAVYSIETKQSEKR